MPAKASRKMAKSSPTSRNNGGSNPDSADFRQRAEQQLAANSKTVPDSLTDQHKLMHELQVHQIELEMQNVALQEALNKAEQAHLVAEHALERYAELFDLAPMAYFNLGCDGIIYRTNSRGAGLLGIDLSRISGQQFANSVSRKDQPEFLDFLKKVFSSAKTQQCELTLQLGDTSCCVAMEAIAGTDRQSCFVAISDLTERKRKEIETQLAITVYKVLSKAIIVSDKDNRILSVNPAFTKLTGYTAEEAIGRSASLLISGHMDKSFYTDMWETVKVCGQWEGEIWNRRKNGDLFLERLTICTVFDDNGEVIRRVSMFSDITENVKNEISLRNSEYRLKIVLDHMPALIGYWNKDLINEFGNKAYTDWFGIDTNQIKGMHLREVIGEDLFALNRHYIENALSGTQQVFERIIKDIYGVDHHTITSYIPDVSENTVKGFFVMVTDITEIKKTELQLRRSRQLSERLLSVSIDGFNFADLHGHFLDANSSFCQILGYTKDEIIEMSIYDIDYLDTAEQIQRRLDKIMAAGFDRFETVHQHKDGNLIDVEVSVAYLPDQEQFFAFTRDITLRKQSEKLRIRQLEKQRDTLVREVHHRIKNHLQGMVGLLSIYSYKNQAEKDLIQDISAKIVSIALVYGIQSKTTPGAAYLCEISQEVCNSLEFFGIERINIKQSIDINYRALLSSEYAVPIALIINELIVNAIKHNSNLSQKEVVVELSFTENTAILTVTNSSRIQAGFPDFEQGLGLGVGLSLVRAMLPKKGAHLTLKQQQGLVCAQITIKFPVINLLPI